LKYLNLYELCQFSKVKDLSSLSPEILVKKSWLVVENLHLVQWKISLTTQADSHKQWRLQNMFMTATG